MERSGLATVYTEQPVTWDEYQEFITSVLAGDDSVDIYIFFLNQEISSAIREQGRYVSLTHSDSIVRYLEKCFDWVGEAARTNEGDIWMLPLAFDSEALFYVPENFDRFDLVHRDVALLGNYFQTVARLNNEKGNYTTHMTWNAIINHWFLQYEIAHNNYVNNLIDYDTETFRDLFKLAWNGWNRDDAVNRTLTHHPILQYDHELFWKSMDTRHETGEPLADQNVEQVIFKLDYIQDQFAKGLDGWRILPFPRLSEKVNHNYITTVYAVVNPHGKNIDEAVAYLETAAEDMLSAITRPAFVYKDLAIYEGHFDLSLPVYQDIHELYRNGASRPFLFYSYMVGRSEYQNNRFTLDEAIAEIQRQAEMWLHE
jgi:ABC-type glycerol-3-phosphate transport system substrate-binding protein